MVYLVVNLGAERCTLVKGRLAAGGRVSMETVHSFINTPVKKGDGSVIWDIERIYSEIVLGLRKAGKVDYLSINGWGYDFVLLDESGSMIGDAVSFSDSRTARLESKPDRASVFRRTGIQSCDKSTIYQLLALKEEHPEQLEKASFMLFIPDYIAYRLTGIIKHEYTYAAVTGLVDPRKRTWDHGLIDDLGLPVHLFTELSDPGCEVGRVKDYVASVIGCVPMVMLSASYAAASEALACKQDALFLIAGDTFTLGCMDSVTHMDEEAMYFDISNEGDTDGNVRITSQFGGLSVLRGIAREKSLDSFELCYEAIKNKAPGTFSTADDDFSACEAIENFIGKGNLSAGELASAAYHSIALTVKNTVSDLQKVTGRSFSEIFVVGEGGADSYLMKLIAMYTGLIISVGRKDGAALGNIIGLMTSSGEIQPSEHDEIVEKASFITRYRRI